MRTHWWFYPSASIPLLWPLMLSSPGGSTLPVRVCQLAPSKPFPVWRNECGVGSDIDAMRDGDGCAPAAVGTGGVHSQKHEQQDMAAHEIGSASCREAL